jgi:hypothetical protein
MASSIGEDVAKYCSSTESSAEQDGALARVLAEVEAQKITLKKLVELLGPYLTSSDDIQRSRGSFPGSSILAPRASVFRRVFDFPTTLSTLKYSTATQTRTTIFVVECAVTFIFAF